MPRRVAPTWVARDGCAKYGLTGIQRSVLLCLWDHANGALEAWPAAPTIASQIGFSDRAVKDALRTLYVRGFIRRADGRVPGERGPHNRHAVRWVLEPIASRVDKVPPVVQEVH